MPATRRCTRRRNRRRPSSPLPGNRFERGSASELRGLFYPRFHGLPEAVAGERPAGPGDHLGIGAFNLLRRMYTKRSGGHGKIALRPDDDVRLGSWSRKAALHRRSLSGPGSLEVEWHQSVSGAVKGLTKSIFAGWTTAGSDVIFGAALLPDERVAVPGGIAARGAARKLSGLKRAAHLRGLQPSRGGIRDRSCRYGTRRYNPVGAGLLTYAVREVDRRDTRKRRP